ncbi:MAG: hypothetical protein HYV02_00290 [Deltaproteobacteria bacterium]|nr:hypothetical protein [Deltaproteobacteria bacterium]
MAIRPMPSLGGGGWRPGGGRGPAPAGRGVGLALTTTAMAGFVVACARDDQDGEEGLGASVVSLFSDMQSNPEDGSTGPADAGRSPSLADVVAMADTPKSEASGAEIDPPAPNTSSAVVTTLATLTGIGCSADHFIGDCDVQTEIERICCSCSSVMSPGSLFCYTPEGIPQETLALDFRPDQLAFLPANAEGDLRLASTWHNPVSDQWGAATVNMTTGAIATFPFPPAPDKNGGNFFPNQAKGITTIGEEIFVAAGNVFFTTSPATYEDGLLARLSPDDGTFSIAMIPTGGLNPTTLDRVEMSGGTELAVANTGAFDLAKNDFVGGNLARVADPYQSAQVTQQTAGGVGVSGEGTIIGHDWLLPAGNMGGNFCSFSLINPNTPPLCSQSATDGKPHFLTVAKTFPLGGSIYVMGCDYNAQACHWWQVTSTGFPLLRTFHDIVTTPSTGVADIVWLPQQPPEDANILGHLDLSVGPDIRRLTVREGTE